MGSSKVILAGAISLMVGLYSVGIKKMDKVGADVTQRFVENARLDRAADVALRMALNDLARERGNVTALNRKVFGGKASYTISNFLPNGKSANITITVESGGLKKQVTANVQKNTSGVVKKGPGKPTRGQWEVVKVFSKSLK